MKKQILLILLTLNLNTIANENIKDTLNKDRIEFEEHQKYLNSLQRNIEIKKLELQSQNLTTDLQRSIVECQGLKGCGGKTHYTTPETKKDKDAKLRAIPNKPLPKITGISNQTVYFDNLPQIYTIGDVVHGVWVIKSINATSISLKSKDDNSIKTIYYYWSAK